MKGKALYFVVLLVVVAVFPVASEELDIDAMISERLQSILSEFKEESLILTRTSLIGSIKDIPPISERDGSYRNFDVTGLLVALAPPMNRVLISGLTVRTERYTPRAELVKFFLPFLELEHIDIAIDAVVLLSEFSSVTISFEDGFSFFVEKGYPIRVLGAPMNLNQIAAFKELLEKGKDWLIDTESELIGEQE